MLTKIELTDFQCHKSLTLNLGKITTLVGPSDSGKSAVMRALDWTVFNNGKKALFIRRGAKVASVSITVDDHIITRTTKDNSYIVDGTELSAIGRSIPVDVSDIFRMSDDNIQRQHEYLFWFSATGAELTRNFNRVVDLSKLDEWVRVGMETEKKFKQDVRYGDKRLDELQEEETSLLPYEKLSKEAEMLSADYDALKSRNEYLSNLQSILGELNRSAKEMGLWHGVRQSLLSVISRYEDIQRDRGLIGLYDQLTSNKRVMARFRSYVSKLSILLVGWSGVRELRTELQRLGGTVEAYRGGTLRLGTLRSLQEKNIPFDELFSLRSTLSELTEILGVLRLDLPDSSKARLSLDEFRSVSMTLADVSTTVSALGQHKDSVDSLRRQLSQIQDEFEERSDGVCPLCGQQTGGHSHG